MLRALAILAMLAAPALADDPVLTEDELKAEISGHTLTGFNTSGVRFSEWHAPDGRVLGHNNGVPNQKSCWFVRDGTICYDYARPDRRETLGVSGTFCWRLKRMANGKGYGLESLDTGILGLATLEPGNPRDHGDGGQPWDCNGLISLRPDRPAAKLAAR